MHYEEKIFALLSSAMLIASCSSSRGNLLSKVEYQNNSVFQREEYHYSDGELALVTRVIYFNNTRTPLGQSMKLGVTVRQPIPLKQSTAAEDV